jgi:hypothetical protein
MESNNDLHDTSAFSFRMDLMKLNLHLAECEKAPEASTVAHEAALAKMRTLENRSQPLS